MSNSSAAATFPLIRTATIADATAIAAIYNQAIRAGNATLDIEEKTAAEIQGQLEGLGERELILVLEDDDRVQGWGIIKKYSDRAGYRVCCETSVYVDHSRLRRGYGSLLKREIIKQCRQLGYHHLVAKIMTENQASIAYNLKLGYEWVGTQRAVGYADGRWRDVTIMQLVLEDVPPYQPEVK